MDNRLVSMASRMAEILETAEAHCVEGKPTLMNISPADLDIAAAMLRAYAEVVDGWRPIDTAPVDGTHHARGLHVYSRDGTFLYWDAIAGYIDDEDGIFYDLAGDVPGWEAGDFTHWAALPPSPPLTAALSTRGEGETP